METKNKSLGSSLGLCSIYGPYMFSLLDLLFPKSEEQPLPHAVTIMIFSPIT